MARAVRQSSYRHVFGTEAKSVDQFLGIKAEFPSDATNNIAASPHHFALPWKGGGGPVYVSDFKTTGRLGSSVNLIQTHKQAVIALQFNPFADKILATAGEDAYIHINEVPEGTLKEHITKPAAVLQGHSKKITLLQFHPSANNVLASISADNTVKTWDVQAGSETTSFDVADQPLHVDWNTDGSLAIVAAKDKHFYLLDPRQKGAAQKQPSFSTNKKYSMLFADNTGAILGADHQRPSHFTEGLR
jgi:coronin-1B/1C/6